MKKILIVDDQLAIRRLISHTLERYFELFEAEDGETGLEMARRIRPALMVLDVMMPGKLDGLQVLDAIKSDPDLQHIHVIIVTAKGQAHDYAEGMRHGADAYVIKPFSPLQLAHIIEKQLSGHTDEAIDFRRQP